MYNESWSFWLAAFGKYYTPSPFLIGYTNPAVLAAGATQQFTREIAGDATVAICGVRHVGSTAAWAAVTGDFTLRLSVESRELENQAIDSFLYGNAIYALANAQMLQTTFTFPYFVDPGGTINGTIVNGALANAFIHIVFDCVKLFPRSDVPEAKQMRPLDLLAHMSYRQAQAAYSTPGASIAGLGGPRR